MMTICVKMQLNLNFAYRTTIKMRSLLGKNINNSIEILEIVKK